MSFFEKTDEMQFEFDYETTYTSILENLSSNENFNDFFIIENKDKAKGNWDFVILRNVDILQVIRRGSLGYEANHPRTYQQVIVVAIQDMKKREKIELDFPHSSIIYASSWENFKHKLNKIIEDAKS